MPGTEQERADALKCKYGGELSQDERAFLDWVQGLFKKVLAADRGFHIALELIAPKMLVLLRAKFDVSKFSETNIDIYKFFQDHNPDEIFFESGDAALTERERVFCRDVIAVVDFVVRNGIGFPLIANLLCHDIDEILRATSLDIAINRGFSPKTSGWGEYNAESFGDPDETQE